MQENELPGIPNGNSATPARPQAWEKHPDPATSLWIFHGCSFPAAPPGRSRTFSPRSQIPVGDGHVLALPTPCLVPPGRPAFPCRSFPKVIPAPLEAEKRELSGTWLIPWISSRVQLIPSEPWIYGILGAHQHSQNQDLVGFEAVGGIPAAFQSVPVFQEGAEMGVRGGGVAGKLRHREAGILWDSSEDMGQRWDWQCWGVVELQDHGGLFQPE